MSAWADKYVIGLTGNIATGKSVVRKMLEHLGAYGIDADALVHRALAQGAPGYQPVVDTFGRWILAPDGQIDRSRLGRLVFSDPEALAQLEAIVHPLVRQAIDLLVRRSAQKVIVIEAIKLLEGPLKAACDSIWVTAAPLEIQMARLVEQRGMAAGVARQRIEAQASQESKIALADVVIQNSGSFEETWRQVLAAWQKMMPALLAKPELAPAASRSVPAAERASPLQAGEIAGLVGRLSGDQRRPSEEDILAAFSEKTFFLLRMDGRPVATAGWQVENLVARVSDVYLEPDLPLGEMMSVLMGAIERASDELQCESLLLFLPTSLAGREPEWKALGYEMRRPEDLGVRAWQKADTESMPAGTVMLFKQLRKERVLRPL